jgi:hypothetical protein
MFTELSVTVSDLKEDLRAAVVLRPTVGAVVGPCTCPPTVAYVRYLIPELLVACIEPAQKICW